MTISNITDFKIFFVGVVGVGVVVVCVTHTFFGGGVGEGGGGGGGGGGGDARSDEIIDWLHGPIRWL